MAESLERQVISTKCQSGTEYYVIKLRFETIRPGFSLVEADGWLVVVSVSHSVVASFKLISCFAAFAFEKTRMQHICRLLICGFHVVCRMKQTKQTKCVKKRKYFFSSKNLCRNKLI